MPDKSEFSDPTPELLETIGPALAKIPTGLFVLTAQHEDRRMGMLTSLVQQVCFHPPAIVVSVAKGRTIMPLISESRRFALCQLADDDTKTVRKFTQTPTAGEDPFLGYDLHRGLMSELPVLKTGVSFLECELACHMDVESDHDLFVGLVKNGGVHRDIEPKIRLRDDGFDY